MNARPRIRLLVLCALLATGCSTRTLVVESDPPGALVYEDGRLLGRTPLELPFSYGGEREYLLLHDEGVETEDGRIGFKPLRLRRNTENFAFDTFPFDVFVALSPVKVEDRHKIQVTLEPSDLVATMRATGDAWVDGLVERAEGLSARARRAFQESFPAVRPLKESLEEGETPDGVPPEDSSTPADSPTPAEGRETSPPDTLPSPTSAPSDG